jgi:hypothetical protein
MIPADLAALLEREDFVNVAARAEFDADQQPEQLYTWDEALYAVRKAYRDRARAAFAAVLELAGALPAAEQGAAFTREQVDRAVRLAEDRNGKPRDWHHFIDFAEEPEADR